MALISFLSRILSDNLPPFSTLLFLLITALPAYHLVILPIYYSSKSHLSAFPGPTLKLLTPHYTTLLDALHLRTTTLHKWHQKYGPVVRVGPNEISFTSATAIKQIYQDPAMEKDSRLYTLFTHFGANNAFTSRTSNEHGWRRKGVAAKLSWSKVLEKEGVEMWIGKVVGRYLRNIEEEGMVSKVAQDGTGKQLVDVYLLNNWFATDVVTGFIFGAKRGTKALLPDSPSDSDDEEWWQKPAYHRKMVKEHYASTFRAHTYLYVEFPTFMRMVDKLIKIGDTTIKKLSTLAGASYNTPKRERDVLDRRVDDWGWKTWISVKDAHFSEVDETCVAGVLAGLVAETGSSSKNVKLDDEKQHTAAWSDEIAASELMDQMLAGMDTTSDTLSFLLYHLSLPYSSVIQSKLHDELATAFPPSSSLDRLPPFFDGAFHSKSLEVQPNYLEFLQTINALPYLDAVIKETLRLYTSIPGTLPRIVPNTAGRGKIIDGLYIQPGTVVGSFAYGIHRDSSVFDEIHRFKPERWIVPNPHKIKEGQGNEIEGDSDGKPHERTALVDENTVPGGQDERTRVKAMEKRLWAFGSGARGCVGRHLATLEMKILIATIYWRYKTETVTDKEAQIFGKLDHSHWDHRKTFRDVLPFKGVNGVLAFIPYKHAT